MEPPRPHALALQLRVYGQHTAAALLQGRVSPAPAPPLRLVASAAALFSATLILKVQHTGPGWLSSPPTLP